MKKEEPSFPGNKKRFCSLEEMKKPKLCCYPNCFECPYSDCRYSRLEAEDYTETNQRDYFLYEDSTGRKYHKGTDKEYRDARQVAYRRNKRTYHDRSDYSRKYYQDHADEIKSHMRENYDTRKNTKKCRKYAKKNPEKRREYYRQYYEKNREKKIQQALKRYYAQKSEERENGSVQKHTPVILAGHKSDG